MNNFFSYQPEFLYSINTILSPILFGQSGVMVVGLFGVLVGIVWLLFLKYKKINITTNNIILIILVVWLPLFVKFFYTNTVELRQTLFLLTQSSPEKIRWRYCGIDLNQNFYGNFCRISMFTNSVHNIVPKKSQITIVESSFSVYLEYLLSDSYILNKNIDSSDYLIIYQPRENFNLTNNGELYTTMLRSSNSVGDMIFLGNFDILYQLNQGAVILRKKIS